MVNLVGRTCFHGKPPGAKVEEVLQRGPEEIHDEDIVVLFLSEPPDVRNSDATLQDLVQLGLVEQLGMASFVRLEFDRDFFAIRYVDACETTYIVREWRMIGGRHGGIGKGWKK